jgi:hypothetical protein
MKLITKEILNKIPEIYETENQPNSEKRVFVKFFHPIFKYMWYGVEYDRVKRNFFGFANLNNSEMAELGYFSLTELEEFGVKRDLYWRDTTTLDKIINLELY